MGSDASVSIRSFEAALGGKALDWLNEDTGANISLAAFGGARVFEARVPPVKISSQARPDVPSQWHLMVHLDGEGRYRVRRTALDQRPGAVVLADGRAECLVEHPDGAHVVSWVLPGDLIRPFLPPRPAAVAEMAGGLGSILGRHAVELARGARNVEPEAEVPLVAHLAALAGLSLAAGAPDARARPSHAALMRQRILGLIEVRFREPRLDASAAARDLGMSRRWLHALLAKGGEGFATRLSDRRTEEALRLLRNPGCDGLSVTEIAFSVGFNDLSTFYRQFRRRFDMTPASARADRP